MPRNHDTALARALDTDVREALARVLASATPSDHEHMHGHVKVMLERVSDAVGPSVLKLARAARDGTLPAIPDVLVEPVEFGSPWIVGVSLRRDGDKPRLCHVHLDVPLTASQRARKEVEGRATFAKMMRAESGEPDDEGADLADELTAEIELERRYKEQGYPDDLPHPDTVDAVKEIGFSTYAVPHVPAPGADPGLTAALSRDRTGHTLAQVVEAVTRDGYNPDLAWAARPSRYADERGTRGPGDVETHSGSLEWPGILETVGRALDAAGLARDVEARAREIVTRVYWTPCDPGHGRDLEEFGQALAATDGGIPRATARGLVAELEAAGNAAKLSARLGDVVSVLDACVEAGHVDEENDFVFNDLDSAVHVDTAEGREILVLKDQNGRFLVDVERDGNAIMSLAVARHGLPFGEAVHGRGYTLDHPDLHRDVANHLDPRAPLERGDAMDALASGSDTFPGFLGRYRAEDGRLVCVAPAGIDPRSIRDLNTVVAVLEGAGICLGEDTTPRP